MKRGILFIHGFTGNTQEIQPLAQYISEHTADYIYSLPTLTGHGFELNLKGIHYSHWLRDAENEYRKLAKKADEITIVGFSMGGVLALYLALKYRVEKIVLLSASLKYIDMKQIYKIAMEWIKKRNNLTDEEKNVFRENYYRFKNIRPMTFLNFTEIVRAVSPYLKNIHQPIMIVQGLKDGLVPSDTAYFIYEQVSSKQKVLHVSPNGYHQICLSDDRLQWFQKVLDFLKEEKEI